MSAAAGYVTQYEARVSPDVREWAEALIERWRVEGRSDLVAEDLMRSLVLGAYVAGATRDVPGGGLGCVGERGMG